MADETFYRDIEKFNAIYKLPAPAAPTLLGPERVRNFRDILAEEVDEGLDLAAKYERLLAAHGADEGASGTLPRSEALDVLTELSDWLGDIVVYCASEARRCGIL